MSASSESRKEVETPLGPTYYKSKYRGCVVHHERPYSYAWTIPHFSQQVGPLVSPPFIDRKGRRFNLQIFPKGDSRTRDDYLCICTGPDTDSNASQDRRKVHFKLWAIQPKGKEYHVLDTEILHMQKEYFRKAINWQTLRRELLLDDDDQLKLEFEFCRKPKLNKTTKNEKGSARSLSPSEISNDSPRKKPKLENAISRFVTQTQARSEIKNESRPDVVMSFFDVNAKEEVKTELKSMGVTRKDEDIVFLEDRPEEDLSSIVTNDYSPFALTWTIPNFSQQQRTLVSPTFKDRKRRQFNLQVFPKVDGKTHGDFLSLCICPDKNANASQDAEEDRQKVRFIISAIKDGNTHPLLECESLLTKKKYFREEITLQSLRKKGFLSDNRLKLQFQFCRNLRRKKKKTKKDKKLPRRQIKKDPPRKKKNSQVATLSRADNATKIEPKPDVVLPDELGVAVPNETPESSHATNTELYFSGQHSDVTIVVGGRSFLCHKRILAQSSLIFQSTFNIVKDQDPIDIADLSATVFGQVLYYVYTGKIPFLDARNARGLLTASERFQLAQLKEACENFILKNLITTSTASEIHTLATASNSPKLYAKAMEILSKPEVEIITID